MINISMKKVRPGMIAAQSIYNSAGGSFLSRGAEMNEQYIDRLKKLGVQSLAVTSTNPMFPVQPPPDVVQEKTRTAAIKTIHDCFEQMQQGMMNVVPLKKTAESLLSDIINHQDNLIQLTDIRIHDSYTFAHSVNVAILSAMIGMHCAFDRGALSDLVMSGLLHDLGKIIIPSEVLTKPSSLNDKEMDIVRLHPTASRERIKKLDLPNADLLAEIAAQHHEHIDGSGYPQQLSGDKIHPYARIIALADVYDALTSSRPYKQAYRPHIAQRIMSICSSGQFDEKLMKIFFNTVALYPIGTVLKTNIGYAIVEKSEFGFTACPSVIVFTTLDGMLRADPLKVNIRHNPDVKIESAFEDKDLLSLYMRLKIDPSIYLTEDGLAMARSLAGAN